MGRLPSVGRHRARRMPPRLKERKRLQIVPLAHPSASEGNPREVRYPRWRDRVPRQGREEPVHRSHVPSRRAEVLRVRHSPMRRPGPTVPPTRGPETEAKDGDATPRREAPLRRSPRSGRRDPVLIRADDGHGRGIVAKRKHGPYLPDTESWFKIRNREYSQWAGREKYFERERDIHPDLYGWDGCAFAAGKSQITYP
jgi:hypothetical protein